MFFCPFEQYLSAFNISLDERRCVKNAAVNVALGSKVDNDIESLAQQLVYQYSIRYIAFDEAIAGLVLYVPQVFQVAGIGEFVQIGYLPIRVFFENVTDEVAADKAGAAGDK
jgi:hypothetical protein